MTMSKFTISKHLLNKLESSPHIEGLALSINNLEELITSATIAYYNTDTPLLSDSTYDILENILKEKKPTSKVFTKIGAPIANQSEAVKLDYYMGSINKVKPGEKSLTKWLTKYPGAKVVSEKLDGLSALLIISLDGLDGLDSSRTASASTHPKFKLSLFKHGDGYEGQDITSLLDHVSIGNKDNKGNSKRTFNKTAVADFIKKNCPSQRLALRGEIIIKSDIFAKKYSNLYPKARSLISGIVNSKKYNTGIAEDIDIVFYEIIYPDGLKWDEQFSKIEQLGFNVARNNQFAMLDALTLPELLLDYKKKSQYDIDGIILTDNAHIHTRIISGYPEYSVAFKMALSEQIATTKIKYVEYNISKHGVLNPRICYDPIVIGGDSHQYTTGFNARYILDNKLGPGAEIQIIKSGDVIPYIYKIIKAAKSAQMPDATIKWHWNDTEIDAVLDNIADNDDVRTKKVSAFFEVMRVKGVGEGIVNKLITAGYDDIKSILELTPDIIAGIDGFKLKSATNLYNAIHKVIDVPQPLERIMMASGMFGVGLGEKKFKLVLDKIPNFYAQWCNGKIKRDDILTVEGYSDKTTDLLIDGLGKFKEWLIIYSMLKVDSTDIKANNILQQGNKFAGAVIVFTGVRNAELEKTIETEGGKVIDTVNSKTTLLVAKDVDLSSSKIEKAKTLGIQIISYDKFLKTV